MHPQLTGAGSVSLANLALLGGGLRDLLRPGLCERERQGHRDRRPYRSYRWRGAVHHPRCCGRTLFVIIIAIVVTVNWPRALQHEPGAPVICPRASGGVAVHPAWAAHSVVVVIIIQPIAVHHEKSPAPASVVVTARGAPTAVASPALVVVVARVSAVLGSGKHGLQRGNAFEPRQVAARLPRQLCEAFLLSVIEAVVER